MDEDATLELRIEDVFREEWGRLVATAMRMLGDLDQAEEVVQAGWATAVERWRRDGLPEKPGAWLMTTVRNRALDELRRQQRLRVKHAEIAAEPADPDPDVDADATDPAAIPDERLRLIFTCCHPALVREARVALTLRLLGGLSTREIARAFLVPEATVSQRILRAKKAIADRRLPYRVPEADELAERLSAVLEVVYLIFNEGYAAREGDELVRKGLCDEAIRLADLLPRLNDGVPEVLGVLALMEFQASRHATRADAEGNLVLLEDQDRSLWDRVQIERATGHLVRAREAGPLGPYGVQALIASCHARSPSWEETDWQTIVAGYDALIRLTASPVVALNRAVAVAKLRGPEEGLALVDEIAGDPKLRRYPLLAATRADLLRRLDRLEEAAEEYRRAASLSDNERERAFLEGRLAECTSASA